MHNAAFALNQPFLLVLVSYCYWNKFYKPNGSELIYFSAIVEMSSQKRASVSSEYGTKMLVGCVPWGCVQPVTHRLHVAEGSYECTPPQNYKRKSCEVFAVVFVFGCMVLLLIPKKYLFLFYMYEYVAFMNVCVPCTCSAWGGQKRALDVLQLELQMIMICLMGAGNWTHMPWKNRQFS